MPALELIFEGDGAFESEVAAASEVVHLGNDAPAIKLTVLDGGMASGLPSVAFGFKLPDGRFVIAETSARLIVAAGRGLAARYPELEQ